MKIIKTRYRYLGLSLVILSSLLVLLSFYFLFMLLKQYVLSKAAQPIKNAPVNVISKPSPVSLTIFPTQITTSISTTSSSKFFYDQFNQNMRLEEAGRMEKSQSKDWWVNSGAWMIVENGVGSTLIGDEPKGSKWQLAFAKNDPDETDNGIHPQNIFRLITRTKWQNLSQQAYFKVITDHLSNSLHRRESNGLLFLNRYQDGDNLYYTGIRVDGFVTIKKKIRGAYYTLAQSKVLDGNYDRINNPTLLPHNKWIGLKTEVINTGEGVNINVYLDSEKSGTWKLALQADDKKGLYGGDPILQPGFGGIRTDFMDVQFEDYLIEEN